MRFLDRFRSVGFYRSASLVYKIGLITIFTQFKPEMAKRSFINSLLMMVKNLGDDREHLEKQLLP